MWRGHKFALGSASPPVLVFCGSRSLVLNGTFSLLQKYSSFLISMNCFKKGAITIITNVYRGPYSVGTPGCHHGNSTHWNVILFVQSTSAANIAEKNAFLGDSALE